MRVVRAFAQESSELDKFTRRNKAYHDITLHLTTLMGAYWGLSDMIGYLQIALSGVCGVYFAVHGGFSLGNVLLFTTYTSMLTFPMRQLGRILADLGKADISLSRLEDILAVPAEAEPGKALTPQIDGSVALRTCFDYGDGMPVPHVSFTVPRPDHWHPRQHGRGQSAWCSRSGCRAAGRIRFPVLTSTTSNAITCAATWASFYRNRSVQPHHRRKHRHRPAGRGSFGRICRRAHGLGT
ncbi:MAG: ABC transporter transmembrane domain-containing protein [Ruthenibacterium lactatiformans]